jgi:adenylosuccinate lyase
VIARNLVEVFPYMATENILMAAVAAGGDRQTLHERIRKYSNAATARIKAGAEDNNLLELLRADPDFAQVPFDELLQQSKFVGRAPEQVGDFIAQEITPIRQRYAHLKKQEVEIIL